MVTLRRGGEGKEGREGRGGEEGGGERVEMGRWSRGMLMYNRRGDLPYNIATRM